MQILDHSENQHGKYNAALVLKDLFAELPDLVKLEAKAALEEIYPTLGPRTQTLLDPMLNEPRTVRSGMMAWAYVGIHTSHNWIVRYFSIEGQPETDRPKPGDTLTARGQVNVRAGPIEYLPDTGWTNKRITGLIRKDDKLKVLEVKDIANGFIWVKFRRLP